MLEFVKGRRGRELVISADGPTVYLDHSPMRRLSEDASRRDRFFRLFKRRGTLHISLANVVDTCGNSGLSAYKLERFLERVERHWAPINMNAAEVSTLEQTWHPGRAHPATGWRFIIDYLGHAAGPLSLREVVKLTRGENGSALLREHDEQAAKLRQHVLAMRLAVATDRRNLTRLLPIRTFDPAKPASFVYHALMRVVLAQSFDMTRNDVTDLLHTTVPLAYSDLLDRRWAEQARQVKRRMPDGNGARVFKVAELDTFLDALAGYPETR